MNYGLHKDYVYVGSVPVNVYTETELVALSRFALREHAEKLMRLLPNKSSFPYPDAVCDLVSWVANVQRTHLEPLRAQSDRPSPLLTPRLRRSKSVSTDPRLSPRGPLVQLEEGLIASSNPCVFSDGQRMITPPASSVYSTSRSLLNPTTRPAGPVGLAGPAVLEEAHSESAEILARRHPQLAAVVLQEVEQGILKLHDGAFGGDSSSQRRMADDLDRRLNSGPFGGSRDRYSNFTVEIGQMPFSASRPCFCFRAACPHTWAGMTKSVWITVCFAPSEFDLYTPDDYSRARDTVNARARLDIPVEARQASRFDLSASRLRTDGESLRAWESVTPWRDAIQSSDGGFRMSLKSEFELSAMSLAAQRNYVMALHQKLGGDRVGLQIPGVGEDLVGWCLGAQRLRAVDPVVEAAAVDKLDDAVGTKQYTDANGRKVTTNTKVDASGWEVRTTNVQDGPGSSSSISRTLCPRGGLNSPIKRTVHDPYVEGFRAKTWQDRLEGITAGGPGLWGVRRSSLLDDPLWSADLRPRSPINYSDPLWKSSVRALV